MYVNGRSYLVSTVQIFTLQDWAGQPKSLVRAGLHAVKTQRQIRLFEHCRLHPPGRFMRSFVTRE